MKIEDVIIGQRYRIVRKGLVNTGRIGRCSGKNGFKVKLLMEHNNTELTLNAMSIEPVEQGKAAKVKDAAKRKPVENELVKPKQKPAKIFEERPVLKLPPEDSLVIVRAKDGSLNKARLQNLDFVDDKVYIHGDDLTERYVGFIPHDSKFKIKKPADLMEYPFWNDDEMFDGMELTFVGARTDFGSLILTAKEGFDVLAKWVDLTAIQRMTTAKVEVDADGNKVVPPIREQALKLMHDHAKQAKGLSFSLFWEYNGKLDSGKHRMAACHYYMKCFVDGEKRKHAKALFAAQFITQKHYENMDKQVVDDYLTWVMNDSPWSRYIETKDLAEAKEKGIIVRTDIPANAMMCTFYALRYPTEYTAVVKAWGKYVKEGLDPAIAFFKAETGGYGRDVSSHHGLLDTFSMDLQDVIDFINHKEGKIKDTVYDAGYYSYKNVSVHHGSTTHRDHNRTGIQELNHRFTVKKIKEKHPVLGVIEKEIPAIEQIDEFLTNALER